jgi:alpha-beta hydrolase superfamily lysophospholipase
MGRYVLAAHSMGALIASDFLQNHAESDLYPERVFLSAPVVGLSGPLGPIANLLPRNWTNNLASMKFGMQLGGLVDLNCLSHDPRIKQQYTNDPLNILKLHTSLLFGMLDTSKRVFSAPLNLKCPTAIIVGTDDQIVSPEHIEKYFTLIEKGQTLKLIEGGRHELHNEIERYRTPYCEFLKDFLLQVLSKK